MKNIVFLCFVILFFSYTSNAQTKLGEVATVYLTTTNLDSSVLFYEKLGFSKIASNDFPSPWAQVSDGSLLIMMRKDATPYIGLTYYTQDPEKIVAALEKDSVEFYQKPKQGDLIKRFYIKSPDGFNIVISNNLGGFKQPLGTTLLNMNPVDYDSLNRYPNKICGVFGEFAQPVKDIKTSLAFWEKLGFTTNAIMNEPYPHAIISDGLMIIGLHQTQHFDFPVVTYFGIDTQNRVNRLKSLGFTEINEVEGKNNVDVTTWEGQHFFLFTLGL